VKLGELIYNHFGFVGSVENEGRQNSLAAHYNYWYTCCQSCSWGL